MNWKQGDWCIFDLNIGQIKELTKDHACFSDGMFSTHGDLKERFRPLTLEGKRIIETLDHYYMDLRKIDGEAGFNYPDIYQYFCGLALNAIDDGENKNIYEKASQFVASARDYTPVIDGVNLFRRKLAAG